ncbi:signal peptidase I [Nanoarchaeota archaeon]
MVRIRELRITAVISLIFMFAMGWLANAVYIEYNSSLETEEPFSFNSLIGFESPERYSPADHISEDQIHVFNDKIIIDLTNAEWSTFTDTNSMDPLFDSGANGLEIIPETPDEIKVGDVVSYHSEIANGLVIHRVIEKDIDEQGVYFILKGDNNKTPDPEKVRFKDVSGIMVGILY